MFCGEYISAHRRTPGWEDGDQNTSTSRQYSYKLPQPFIFHYFTRLNGKGFSDPLIVITLIA
jgi:hypothetical protein